MGKVARKGVINYSKEVAKKVYGYEKGGSWPFADSLDDLLKLVNYLLELEEKKTLPTKV
jgi:hypothetical protein